MKNLLGAIAAAMLLGAGCAHERGSTTQTEAPASPRTSMRTSWGTSGLTCEAINGKTAGVSSSAPVQSGTGGSASGEQSAIGRSSSDQIARDDAASQVEILEGKAIGGSGNEQSAIGESPSEQKPIGRAPPGQIERDDAASQLEILGKKAKSFEDTDMGGTGGGGG